MERIAIIFVAAAVAFGAQAPQIVQRPGETAKPPAKGAAIESTGVIRGNVTGPDGLPLRQAAVRIVGTRTGLSRGEPTDADGKYQAAGLPPDSYLVTASKAGYVTVEYGQRRASYPGKRVKVADGDAQRIDFTLPRAAILTGRVVDEYGDPVQGATVALLAPRFAARGRSLVSVTKSEPTNDLGRFRLVGVEAGEYVVAGTAATAGPYRLPGYSTTFFPGVSSVADASLLTIAGGDEPPAVDITLLPGRAATIAGTALASNGEPYRGRLQIAGSERSGALAAPSLQTLARPDGTFEFPNVAPGDYVVQTIDRGALGGEFAHQFVSVADRDIRGLSLHASAGSTVSGRITFEDSPTHPSTQSVRFMFLQTDFDLGPPPGSYRARINDDWTFEYVGLFGPLLLRPETPPDWLLKSVRAGGMDITDKPTMFGRRDQSLTDVEVVLTNHAAEVAGTVADARGQPVAACAVVVFSTDRNRWQRASRYIKEGSCDADGAFSVRALPSGEYFVTALDRIQGTGQSADWQAPTFLEVLAASAARVTATESQTGIVSLRLNVR
jgi:hypothetical protein